MNIPGNTSYIHLITINFKIEVDQAVSMLGRDIPLLCKKFYTLNPCTFEAGVHLKLFQAALHRHKYSIVYIFFRQL